MRATSDDLIALDMEYRLTVAFHITMPCHCAAYFTSRREVLLPEVVKEAARRKEDVVDLFADYARKVHLRSMSGLSLAVTS